MHSIESTVSAENLTGLLLLMLYAPVFFLSYRWFFPRLSPTCARIAGAFLAAQALVILLALQLGPDTSPDWWRWDLNREYNIASTLASLQLAMVGGLALIMAALARGGPAWRRLYLLALAVIFLILAWDEYFKVHEEMRHWKRYYAALGMALAVATMYVAFRSPPRARMWQVCLLAGLAASGAGAILIEELPLACGNLGWIRLDGCLEFDVWEECLELLGVWLALVAMLGGISDLTPSPSPRIRFMLIALPAFWLLPIFSYVNIPQLELQLLAKPASAEFESSLVLHGYQINRSGEAIRIRLYVTAKRGIYEGIGYSVHLRDPTSGDSITRADRVADPAAGFWMIAPGHAPLYRQSMELTIPRSRPASGALWVTLSLWRKQDAEQTQLHILKSDHKLLAEGEVLLQELAGS